MEDTLWQGLTDMLAGLPMGITAENLAEKYGISREECDEFAVLTQQRWGVGRYYVYPREMSTLHSCMYQCLKSL